MTMMTAMAAPEARTRISATRLIAACSIGNALEFYDFVIYSFFAATIGRLFFPSQDPAVQILRCTRPTPMRAMCGCNGSTRFRWCSDGICGSSSPAPRW